MACSTEQQEKNQSFSEEKAGKWIEKASFQAMLDSAEVQGTILIYDAQEDVFYSNDFEWAKKGQLPASTYKIPHSIIALETGVMESDSTLIEWNGQDHWLDIWEQDLMLKQAFHYSCVPCYQQIARKVGEKRMNALLEKLAYGAMQVDSSNIDRFWLGGKSRISPFEQIDFLRRFYDGKLPISNRTFQLVKQMIVMDETATFPYKTSGKTGWSMDNDHDNGWFVGYVEEGGQLYFFATNVEPKPTFDMTAFASVRKSITYQALLQLMR